MYVHTYICMHVNIANIPLDLDITKTWYVRIYTCTYCTYIAHMYILYVCTLHVRICTHVYTVHTLHVYQFHPYSILYDGMYVHVRINKYIRL